MILHSFIIEVVNFDLISAEVSFRNLSRKKVNLPPSVFAVMNLVLKLPSGPGLTHLAERSSGYQKLRGAKAHLESIHCCSFFCRSGHDLNLLYSLDSGMFA